MSSTSCESFSGSMSVATGTPSPAAASLHSRVRLSRRPSWSSALGRRSSMMRRFSAMPSSTRRSTDATRSSAGVGRSATRRSRIRSSLTAVSKAPSSSCNSRATWARSSSRAVSRWPASWRSSLVRACTSASRPSLRRSRSSSLARSWCTNTPAAPAPASVSTITTQRFRAIASYREMRYCCWTAAPRVNASLKALRRRSMRLRPTSASTAARASARLPCRNSAIVETKSLRRASTRRVSMRSPDSPSLMSPATKRSVGAMTAGSSANACW